MKNIFLSMLNEGELVDDFWTTTLPILRYILFGIVMLSAIVMIVTTLMQSNDSENGLDAFAGGGSKESYYSQNKGASKDAILKRITIAMGIIIFVCIILFFVSELIAGV